MWRPQRAPLQEALNHVVSKARARALARVWPEMGGPTPSKYGGLNHSSFVGGDAPEALATWRRCR